MYEHNCDECGPKKYGAAAGTHHIEEKYAAHSDDSIKYTPGEAYNPNTDKMEEYNPLKKEYNSLDDDYDSKKDEEENEEEKESVVDKLDKEDKPYKNPFDEIAEDDDTSKDEKPTPKETKSKKKEKSVEDLVTDIIKRESKKK